MLIAETGPVTERLRVREIDDDEGRRLVRIVRRGSGSVVTWRRAQMVLLPRRVWMCPIAKVAVTFTALRFFTLDGTDHASHKEQASMIRRYIIWRTTTPTTNDSAASSTGQT